MTVPSMREIYELLTSMFAADELRRFLYHRYGEELVANLPERVTKAELVDTAVQALGRRGFLTHDFLRYLEDERPERKAEIARVLTPWFSKTAAEGRGDPGTPLRAQAFCYFAPEDAAAQVSLRTHLTPLVRSGQLELESCASIVAGTHREVWLSTRLTQSNLLLFLVSPFLLMSSHRPAIALSMARHHVASARLVPILLRPLRSASPFAPLQSLPPAGQCIEDYADMDAAWVAVCAGLRTVLAEPRNEVRS